MQLVYMTQLTQMKHTCSLVSATKVKRNLQNSACNSPKEQMFLILVLSYEILLVYSLSINPEDHPKICYQKRSLMSFFCSSASPWAKVHSSPAKVGEGILHPGGRNLKRTRHRQTNRSYGCFQKNMDTPKWMVYNGKPFSNG